MSYSKLIPHRFKGRAVKNALGYEGIIYLSYIKLLLYFSQKKKQKKIAALDFDFIFVPRYSNMFG